MTKKNTNEPETITDHDTLVKAVEEFASEDTLVRIVEMLDKTYNIHRLLINDKIYFVGVEGDFGVPLIGITDPLACVDYMEDYLLEELAAYSDIKDHMISDRERNPKYLIN